MHNANHFYIHFSLKRKAIYIGVLTKILYILLSLTLLGFNTIISHHDNFSNYVSISSIQKKVCHYLAGNQGGSGCIKSVTHGDKGGREGQKLPFAVTSFLDGPYELNHIFNIISCHLVKKCLQSTEKPDVPKTSQKAYCKVLVRHTWPTFFKLYYILNHILMENH